MSVNPRLTPIESATEISNPLVLAAQNRSKNSRGRGISPAAKHEVPYSREPATQYSKILPQGIALMRAGGGFNVRKSSNNY